MNEAKPFNLSKQLVLKAYQSVKENRGSAGIDQQTLDDFDRDLKNNLYKIWNRLSSGSYFPPPVKAVEIPKKSGGARILGIPTVSDRIAQVVVRELFEPYVEPHFQPDSYGYRPKKSALEAINITQQRCWKYDWMVEFDIKGLFDNIDHNLLLKAVRKHTDDKILILYIERWLKAPIQLQDGTLLERSKGTPQGGVISPVLSNLFMHYVFDTWMERQHKGKPRCRYADDGLIHCRTEEEAQNLLSELIQRLAQCGLEAHPEKTKIVYCKDVNRKKSYSNTEFTFLGYDFRKRSVKHRKGNAIFLGFNPAASKDALKSMRATIRKSGLSRKTELDIQKLAHIYNPILRGWLEYYGKFSASELRSVLRCFNKALVKWAMRKYKKLKGRKIKAALFVQKIMEKNPALFEHWKRGMIGAFA